MRKNSHRPLLKLSLFLQLFVLLFIIIFLSGLTGCKDEEADPLRLEITGEWFLKSATFDNHVDLDGSGPMYPTNDAKSVLADLFRFYDNCSSVDDIILKFTLEKNIDNSGNYNLYKVCPEGQGNPVPELIATYKFEIYSQASLAIAGMSWFVDDVSDPHNLFTLNDWGLFLWVIEEYTCIDGTCTFSGTSMLESNLPEPKPQLGFSFVMEKID